MSNQKQPAVSDLWGDENSFIQLEDVKVKTKKVLAKINNPLDAQLDIKKILKSNKVSFEDKMYVIRQEVERVLGRFKPFTLLISTKEQLRDYIDKCIENNVIAIDTETNNSLDPHTCKIMGLCLYTPNEKNVYVPINHIDNETGYRLSWQLTEQDIQEELQRIVDANTRTIWHNAKFDYQIIKMTCNVEMKNIYWDTMIGCRLIDENEKSAKLKDQYIDKIDPTLEVYSIEKLFSGVKYEQVEPELFALYSATDAYETYKLYEYQEPILTNQEGPYRLFRDVEIPLIIPVAEMELFGVKVDKAYAQRLEIKYSKLLKDYDNLIDELFLQYKDVIAQWRLTPEANKREQKKNKKGKTTYGKSKSEQFCEPYNLESSTQLAIFLYDVLQLEPVDEDNPRSTDKYARKELLELHPDIKILKALSERKTISTLMSDFITKLPTLINKKTDAIHCSLNPLGKEEKGVVTGRFSSSNPNLQQIPSHNKEVRMLFRAREGYKLVGGDYSAQEPRLTAYYSQDPNMLKAYREGKDLYSVIASISFNKPYEDCLEFYPEGTKITVNGNEVICGHKTNKNKAGAERRSQAKSILLGLEYGRGARSIGEQIHKTKEEAQVIIDTFFKSFPKVKDLIEKEKNMAKTLGYVEDWYGRRRHLPESQLPKYTITYDDKSASSTFNPFLNCENRLSSDVQKMLDKYEERLNKAKYRKEIYTIIDEAKQNKVTVIDNTVVISKSERQSINSIIQGGAATLTKMAMINIHYDKKLRELGYQMLIPIHDEILGECPEENSEECEKRLTEIMIDTAKPYLNVPMSCDTYCVDAWYEDEYATTIQKEYKEYLEGDEKEKILPLSEEEAYNKLILNHTEQTENYLRKILGKD